MARIVSHHGLRTGRNPTPEAIAAIKLPAIQQGVGGWGIDEDFIVSHSSWTTADNTGSAMADEALTIQNGKGGYGRIDSGTSTDRYDSVYSQIVGGAFAPTVGAKIYFGALLKVATLDGVNFAGLSTPAAVVFNAGTEALVSASHIGFEVNAGNVKFLSSGDTAIDTNINAVADQFIKLEFVVSDTNSVIPYVNGVQYPAAKLSSPPTLAMTPTISHQIGVAHAENVYLTMDWVKCYQSEDIVRVGSA